MLVRHRVFTRSKIFGNMCNIIEDNAQKYNQTT